MIITFLYSLSGGILLILATANVRQIAWPFLRLMGFFSFALVCSATVWTVTQDGRTGSAGNVWSTRLALVVAGSAFALVMIAPFVQRVPRAFRVLASVGGLAGLCATSLSTIARLDAAGLNDPLRIALLTASAVLGSALLGSMTVAWLLGHAYLTATTMTIDPLRHFSRMLSWSITVRLAFSVFSVGLAAWVGGTESVSIITELKEAWLIVSLRVVVGLVAVALFAYMVSACVRLRSTQSATGILYFGSVCAYVGEFASQQLIVECGWPI